MRTTNLASAQPDNLILEGRVNRPIPTVLSASFQTAPKINKGHILPPSLFCGRSRFWYSFRSASPNFRKWGPFRHKRTTFKHPRSAVTQGPIEPLQHRSAHVLKDFTNTIRMKTSRPGQDLICQAEKLVHGFEILHQHGQRVIYNHRKSSSKTSLCSIGTFISAIYR